VLLARRAEKLDRLVVELDGDARSYSVDCADPEAVSRVASRVVEEVGTPDVVVNNAGAGRWLYLEETEPEELVEMFRAPFLAAVFVTRAFLPAMIARGSGLIVNVNAPIAFVPYPGAAGYGAARWALRGLNDLLRVDLVGTGVKVSQVVPAAVASEYRVHNPGIEKAIPGIARLIPTLTPDQVARTIVRTIEREPRLVFTPFMLRLIMALNPVLPGVLQWLTRQTGRKRADRS
jgi:NADP-dependent 3-hydroxy acid dehydrogenase YdfG